MHGGQQGAGGARAARREPRSSRKSSGGATSSTTSSAAARPMQEIFATIMRVAPTRATVLLAGESGVGKDLIARAIHFHSPRSDRPLVKINCTALPENLMESELFGYEKGAFTGAQTTKPGKFEQADTGTVFLDEIGDVPATIQVKLLRVLQEREFERLGSNMTQPHRRARDRGDQPGSARGARAGHVSRGSVLPAERGADRTSRRCASARRTSRFWPNHFVHKLAPDIGEPGGSDHGCGHGEADGVSLAGQCARTGERDRAQPGDGVGNGAGRGRYQAGDARRARAASRTSIVSCRRV